MTFIQSVVQLIFGIFQTGLIFFFFYKTVGPNPKVQIIHIILAGLAVNILIWIPVIFWFDAFWRPIWGFGLLFSAIFLLFSGSIRERLLYMLITSILSAFSGIISETAGVYILPDTLSIYESTLINQAIMLFINSVAFLLLIGGLLHINTKGKLHLPGNYWVLATALYSLLLVIGIILEMESVNIQQRIPIIVGGAVLLLSFSFVLYFAFYFICRYFEAKTMAMQNEMIEKYIIQKQEADKMIKILSHDLRHNLLRWKQLAENEGYIEVLDGISEYERTYEANRLVDAGNDAANAIINQKLMAARNKEIQFDVKGVFSEGLSVTDIDLCSLLGNLLDNAIEACEKVKEASKRRISLDIKRDGNFIFLEAVNSYEIEPEVKGGRFITKKGRKLNHGIGMLSINSVVKKYEGAIDNTFQNNNFRTVIMLRAYE